VIDTIAMDGEVSHVTFTPDGKHALAPRFSGHKVSVLDVDGEKVTYNKVDVPGRLWVYDGRAH
jgi:hypothetical protein